MNLDAIYYGGSTFANENYRKTQTANIAFFSDERTPPFGCADAQFIFLRLLRPSKYIKNASN